MKRLGPLWLSSTLCLAQCSAEDTCTEVGCDHQAVVTYPAGLVMGAYDLVVAGDGRMLAARCLDPSAPETADNPPELDCDAEGFELRADPLANARTVTVTIIDVASEDVLVDAVEVTQNAVGEEQPNGPGCPPTCFVRNGRLMP